MTSGEGRSATGSRLCELGHLARLAGAAAIADQADSLARRVEEGRFFVAEAGNPGNQKGVLSVEVFAPSPLLASGMCLVDTPGLGSVVEANTAATREFIPHIDAVVAVLGICDLTPFG